MKGFWHSQCKSPAIRFFIPRSRNLLSFFKLCLNPNQCYLFQVLQSLICRFTVGIASLKFSNGSREPLVLRNQHPLVRLLQNFLWCFIIHCRSPGSGCCHEPAFLTHL